KVLIEFVSANPTGPLHIGHGRGAALGDSLQRILNFAGFDVESEYYINDSGLQIENLGRSLIYRATELTDQSTDQLELLYKGDYLIPIARKFVEMIEQKKLTLDNENILELASEFATNTILADIKEELTTFNVKFNNWFSEKSLHDSKKVDLVIDKLLSSGEIYEKDGALWLKTESANDEKDRVVRRTNGLATYLAADIAYHEDKFNRGFAKIINIFGADHHGYIPRMKAVAKAIGREPDNLIVKLIQLVNLKRGGEIISMSTREGLFTSLNEIVNEVGIDACRYFFVNRSAEAKLDFDLDLAKLQTEENPVFYIQYAYARSASIFRLADERSIKLDSFDEIKETLLNNSDELRLIKKLLVFPEIVKSSADNLAPLHIADYLKELAALFHRFYKFNRIITEEIKESKSKLMLLKAVMITIKNGLNLLGVKAPERM
ncbi:MAG: arginine--tRNA ligase, partial [Nitrospinota bacterium]